MQYVKGLTAAVLMGASFWGVSQTESIAVIGSTEPAVQATQASASILELQRKFQSASFDAANSIHQIRRQRISYYLKRAEDFHQMGGFYNRDLILERANNILNHHLQTSSSHYALH